MTATGTAPTPAETTAPRLNLKPDRPVAALLDGAWWPRSDDPAAELPDLIQALNREVGIVERLMLGSAEWKAHPKRLVVDDRVVRLGWYASQPTGLLIASTSGVRVDLLVVSPDCGEDVAVRAMAAAAESANTRGTPAIMAGFEIAPVRAALEPTETRWEDEGGRAR